MPVCQFAGKKNAKNWTINHRNVSPKTNGTFEINDKNASSLKLTADASFPKPVKRTYVAFPKGWIYFWWPSDYCKYQDVP